MQEANKIHPEKADDCNHDGKCIESLIGQFGTVPNLIAVCIHITCLLWRRLEQFGTLPTFLLPFVTTSPLYQEIKHVTLQYFSLSEGLLLIRDLAESPKKQVGRGTIP